MSKARVVLERCPSLDDARKVLPLMLEEASLWSHRNLHCLRVLVKPNLLRAVPLACTSPAVAGVADDAKSLSTNEGESRQLSCEKYRAEVRYGYASVILQIGQPVLDEVMQG